MHNQLELVPLEPRAEEAAPDLGFVVRRADELQAQFSAIDRTDREGLMRIGFEAEWLAGHVLENFAGHPLALAVVSKIRLIMKLALQGAGVEKPRYENLVAKLAADPKNIRFLKIDRNRALRAETVGTPPRSVHVVQTQRERRVRRVTRTGSRAGPNDSDPPRPPLTAELRAHLKREVDRARRKELAEQRHRYRALFGGDPGRRP